MIDHVYAYVLYGKYCEKGLSEGECLCMKFKVEELYSDSRIEVGYIEVKSDRKRKGIGSFALQCLETVIIPELNKKIDEYNLNNKEDEGYAELYHIKEIYGTSGSLNSDTNEKARKNFYEYNGYEFRDNCFYKELNKV